MKGWLKRPLWLRPVSVAEMRQTNGHFGTEVDRIRAVRRSRVIRTTGAVLRRTALPGVLTLGVVILPRMVEIGGLLDIRTAGATACLALAYGLGVWKARRLEEEAEQLEDAAEQGTPSSPRID